MIDTFETVKSAPARADDDATQVIGMTHFKNLQANAPTFEMLTVRELAERVANPQLYPSKAACPLIKLAKFGDERTEKGSLRHDKNLQTVYGLEGDYDGGLVSVGEAERMLRQAGVEALIYTSASHTKDHPRWRVLAPLASPCGKEARRAQMDRLNAVLGGCLAPESWTGSQAFYFGRVAGAEYEHRHIAGTPIDLIALNLPAPEGPPSKAAKSTLPSTDEARELDRDLQLTDVDCITFQHMESALAVIPADDHGMWVRIGCALSFFKNTHFEEQAERMWLDWSSKSSKFDAEEASSRWNSLRADRTGYAAVFKVAQDHGWKNPRASAGGIDPDALPAALARCRTMSAEQLEAGWADIALTLAPAQLPRLLAEIHHLTRIPMNALKATLNAAKVEAQQAIRKAGLEARAAGREIILYRPEDRTAHAVEVEQHITATAAAGAYLQFGGHLARIAVRPVVGTRRVGSDEPPDIPQIEHLDSVGALKEVERVAMFVRAAKDGPTPIAVPSEVIEVLLKKSAHRVPVVSGLVSHPIVMPGSGDIVASDGLHQQTGLYFHGAALDGVRPFDQAEAQAALARLRRTFLEGFEFASLLDEDVAIAGLFTGIERKICDAAPGFAAMASAQASGKTTLVRCIHLVLTGHDMPVMSFPDRDDAELQKRLLTMLIRGPAMVCFDNIMDGTTFRSPPMAAAMTSQVLTQRLLGASRETSCPTNVLFCITGNNLSLGADELTRWLVCRLQPAQVRPECRIFKHTDVVAHALEIRRAVLRDALGIIAGYRLYGGEILPASRFPVWDSVVRQPLIWAGGEDVAQCFSANADESEERQAHAALVGCLHARFGEQEFRASDVAAMTQPSYFGDDSDGLPPRHDLGGIEPQGFLHLSSDEIASATKSALLSLQSKDPSSEASVGRVLKGLTNTRTHLVLPSGTVSAYISTRMHNGRRAYKIVS